MDVSADDSGKSSKTKPKPPPKPSFDARTTPPQGGKSSFTESKHYTPDTAESSKCSKLPFELSIRLSKCSNYKGQNKGTKPPLLPKPQVLRKPAPGHEYSIVRQKKDCIETSTKDSVSSVEQNDYECLFLTEKRESSCIESDVFSDQRVQDVQSDSTCAFNNLSKSFITKSLEIKTISLSVSDTENLSDLPLDISDLCISSSVLDNGIRPAERKCVSESSLDIKGPVPEIYVSDTIMREDINFCDVDANRRLIRDEEIYEDPSGDLEQHDSADLKSTQSIECLQGADADSQSTDSSCGSFTVLSRTNDSLIDEENMCSSNSSLTDVRNHSFLHSLNCMKKMEKEKCDVSASEGDVCLENPSLFSSTPKLVNSSTLHALYKPEDVCLRKKDGEEASIRAESWSEGSDYSRHRSNSIESESLDGSTSVRRRISSWFGSFGKGTKQKDKRESCLFYCDDLNVTNENESKRDDSDSSSGKVTVENDTKMHDSTEGLSTQYLDINLKDSLSPCRSSVDVENNTSSVSEESLESICKSNTAKDCLVDESSTDRKQRKAFYVARELMTSEKVFIDVLKLLCFEFKDFIKNSNKDLKSSTIPEDELDKIITSLPQLLHLSEDLFQDLENRIQSWDQLPKISDVLVKKGPFLKLCSVYIQNFEAQCSYLDDCCQKYPRFAKALKLFEQSDRCKKLTLKHYMLKPVQRIPQYRMLLDDYLAHLDEDSPDFCDTQIALQIVSDVANHANKSIKNGEHLCKLLQLQAQLGNYEIIRPYRRFIKEGELCKLSRKENQLRYFILLNDCLLYTSFYGSMTGFRVKYELALNGMKVTVPQMDDRQAEFSIITSTRSFTLRARSVEECEEWVSALQNAIKENNSRQLTFVNMSFTPKNSNAEVIKLGKEAPIWIQDKKVTMCQSCTAEFTVTFRRHHCRACGKVVCGNCSENKAPLQYLKFQPHRVCDDCNAHLLKEFEDPASNMFDTIKTVMCIQDYDMVTNTMEHIHSLFKKQPSSMKRIRKYIPQRLKEVTANDSGSQMSGCMYRRGRRSWKRLWFVLKEQVLYVYKAPEDVVALESVPVLGYKVETIKEGTYDDNDVRYIFQLSHVNQDPLVFGLESQQSANRWVAAFQEATILK